MTEAEYVPRVGSLWKRYDNKLCRVHKVFPTKHVITVIYTYGTEIYADYAAIDTTKWHVFELYPTNYPNEWLRHDFLYAKPYWAPWGDDV